MAEEPQPLTEAEEAELREWAAKHFAAVDVRVRLLATLDAARARIAELEAAVAQARREALEEAAGVLEEEAAEVIAARKRIAELEAERDRLLEAAVAYIAELDRHPYWTAAQTQAEDALRALLTKEPSDAD